MDTTLTTLAITAASIGFFHTLLGPDHYLPFIVMAKARKWSVKKTIWVTVLSGIGHTGSSIVLGFIGVFFGIALHELELIEGVRGSYAAWGLLLFGLGYTLYGIWRLFNQKKHSHIHVHEDGTYHKHTHSHAETHDHVHKKNLTPWILFVIFVLGPCEPLIPILMFPAAENSIGGVILISVIFALVTITTMLAVVLLALNGFSWINLGKLEKYTHVLAGLIVFISGFGILFLGF